MYVQQEVASKNETLLKQDEMSSIMLLHTEEEYNFLMTLSSQGQID
jgi:hypothetical protein